MCIFKVYRVATIGELLENLVSFAECRIFYRALLQKRPTIWRSLHIVATPYQFVVSFIGLFCKRDLQFEGAYTSVALPWPDMCRSFLKESFVRVHLFKKSLLFVWISSESLFYLSHFEFPHIDTGRRRLIGSDHFLSCRSFSTRDPLNIRHFCGKWPIKIRDPMSLRHPVHSLLRSLAFGKSRS